MAIIVTGALRAMFNPEWIVPSFTVLYAVACLEWLPLRYSAWVVAFMGVLSEIFYYQLAPVGIWMAGMMLGVGLFAWYRRHITLAPWGLYVAGTFIFSLCLFLITAFGNSVARPSNFVSVVKLSAFELLSTTLSAAVLVVITIGGKLLIRYVRATHF